MLRMGSKMLQAKWCEDQHLPINRPANPATVISQSWRLKKGLASLFVLFWWFRVGTHDRCIDSERGPNASGAIVPLSGTDISYVGNVAVCFENLHCSLYIDSDHISVQAFWYEATMVWHRCYPCLFHAFLNCDAVLWVICNRHDLSTM